MRQRSIQNIIRGTIQEVYSEKQRKWACAQAGLPAHKRQKSLSKKEAEEMCRDTKISKKSLKEQEPIASQQYKQTTTRRDDESGEVVESSLMLDVLDEKIDTNTEMLTTLLTKINRIEENLSRRWS